MKFLTAATVFSLLYGAAASEGCPELENEMDIAETGATFRYTIVPDSAEGAGDGVIQGCVEVEHDGWLAFGFSSDGKMLGPDGVTHNAVIGGWGADVAKFDLTTKGGTQEASALQTLQDASYGNVDGSAILKFTKLLVEEGEVPINVEGDNFFLYSWGNMEVAQGFHSVYGSVTKDFADDVDKVEPATNDVVQTDTNDVVQPVTNDEVQPVTNDEVQPDTPTDPENGAVDKVEPATNDVVEPDTNDVVQPDTNDEVQPDTLTDPENGAVSNVLSTMVVVLGTVLML